MGLERAIGCKSTKGVPINKYLITGGAGFIGYHLAKSLSENGNLVHVVDNLARFDMDDEFSNLVDRDNVEFFKADLTDNDWHFEIDDNYDQVFHLAAIVGVSAVENHPEKVISINTEALLNVLDWVSSGNTDKFLFASTSEVYAWTRKFYDLPIPTPEDIPLSITDISKSRATYALSKIHGEAATYHFCEDADMPFVITRFHNIYGPRMGMRHVIPEVYKRVYQGEDPVDVYSPSHSRAFCYIDDAIKALRLLTAKDVPNGVYNVGNDEEEVQISSLAKLILEVADKSGMDLSFIESNGNGIKRRCPDISKLKNETGYQPQVSLKEGLQRTIDWYRSTFQKEE